MQYFRPVQLAVGLATFLALTPMGEAHKSVADRHGHKPQHHGGGAPAAPAHTPVTNAQGVLGPTIFKTYEEPFAAHGVAGDDQIAFIVEAQFNPQVHVLHRLTRISLGSLPKPSGGHGLPVYIRTRNQSSYGLIGTQGEVVLLDGPPMHLMGMAPSYLHVYKYKWHPLLGFDAKLKSSHALPLNTNPPDEAPNGFVFAGSFALLPGGDIVVTDFFGLWAADADFTNWRPAFMSPDFGPSPYCSTVTHNGEEVPGFYLAVRDENWNKVRLPYQLRVPAPEPFLPAFKGVTYVDLTDQVVFNRLGTPGGIFALDRTVLLDATTPPFLKEPSVVVGPEIGLTDLAGDVAYDNYHPDSEWVYWQRTPSESGQNTCEGAHPHSEKWSPIYRASILTGEVELVSESWILYDFPTVLSALPPSPLLPGFSYLVTSNVLETRIVETNALVDETTLVPPTIVPFVLVDAY